VCRGGSVEVLHRGRVNSISGGRVKGRKMVPCLLFSIPPKIPCPYFSPHPKR